MPRTVATLQTDVRSRRSLRQRRLRGFPDRGVGLGRWLGGRLCRLLGGRFPGLLDNRGSGLLRGGFALGWLGRLSSCGARDGGLLCGRLRLLRLHVLCFFLGHALYATPSRATVVRALATRTERRHDPGRNHVPPRDYRRLGSRALGTSATL